MSNSRLDLGTWNQRLRTARRAGAHVQTVASYTLDFRELRTSQSSKFLLNADSPTLQHGQDAVAFSLQPHERDAVARSDRGRHVKQCYGHQRFEGRRRNNQAAVGDITRPTVSACLHNHWPL